MKSYKTKFLEKAMLGHSTDENNLDEVLNKCINLAYRDMFTAGRFYSSNFKYSKNEICEETKKIIINENFNFSISLIEKVSKLFSDNEIIKNNKSYVTRFGLSQKLVNMSFKYFFIFSDYIVNDNIKIDFSKCDCPLDSIILNSVSVKKFNHLEKNILWSKITKKDYISTQQTISELLKQYQLNDELKSIGNLAYDFLNW